MRNSESGYPSDYRPRSPWMLAIWFVPSGSLARCSKIFAIVAIAFSQIAGFPFGRAKLMAVTSVFLFGDFDPPATLYQKQLMAPSYYFC
jgi:hypothetical protein